MSSGEPGGDDPEARRDAERSASLHEESDALRSEMALQRHEAQEHEAAEASATQLKNRVAIAAIIFTTALSFIGNVKNNRDKAANDATNASDAARRQGAELWAYYQTKVAERTSLELARDGVELDLKHRKLDRADPSVQLDALRLTSYEARIRAFDSETQRVFYRVQQLELEQEAQQSATLEPTRAAYRYDVANKLIALSLILLSVTILASRRGLFWFGVVLGGAGLLLAFDGYLLLF